MVSGSDVVRRLDGFTPEQITAIERRDGDLLLDASAGSGKTSVLVERFARAVLEDGVDVGAILAITFTDKAAGELRERIRARLRELGLEDAARETEGAFISTIHGFCARLLRAHALSAGIDPLFVVLDDPEAERLADAAFDEVLEELARNEPGGVELIASYGPGGLRGSILDVYAQLRSQGQPAPSLPALGPAPDLAAARDRLQDAAVAAARELGEIADPGSRVVQALERISRVDQVLAEAEPWPGALEQLALPRGNGAALSTPVCTEYSQALTVYRQAAQHVYAARTRDLLDRLLRSFGERYGERKRGCSGLDFEDLELMARALLAQDVGLREALRARFRHVMVDEVQDTNAVQLELIDLLAAGNLFCVGDAQQSIYGFRHADVELFEARAAALAREDRRLSLQVNFRSRPQILEVLNAGFGAVLGERFRPLLAGRESGSDAQEPPVELIVADRSVDWGSLVAPEALAAPWRLAEARALAERVGELLRSGWEPRDVVLLTRATTDLRAYERALEAIGVPTYVIGGRGYWGHPQVVDLVAYLRALANPRDEEALYTVLVSPLVGISFDALVMLSAAAREAERDPWWVLREPEGRLDALEISDRERLIRFVALFGGERSLVGRAGVGELVERALRLTGYDLTMLAMPGGERRLANVRKLMRLAREHEAASGFDLRGFVDLVGALAGGRGAARARESEAPVEGEALNAVRLMTIHRAKGLEFPVVCVADLGRGPWRQAPLVRVGRDGRLGLRLAQPGTGAYEDALDYLALREEQQEFEAAEERRLFYVAMTRACERLVLSGAADVSSWPEVGHGTPLGWIAPAFSDAVGVAFVGPEAASAPPESDVDEVEHRMRPQSHPRPLSPPPVAEAPGAGAPGAAISSLSYSALESYHRCGYRFYTERVLGVPPVDGGSGRDTGGGGGSLSAAERGVVVHALLERLDFRRPLLPEVEEIRAAAPALGVPDAPALGVAEAREIRSLMERFLATELAARLGRSAEVRREERFAFLLGDRLLVTGALDVLAREPGGRLLVVDYKSDRLEGAAPEELVARGYETQRLVYALAALRAGASEVEVAHVFLEASDRPAVAVFAAADAIGLESRVAALAAGIGEGRFAVTDTPHRGVCAGCPAEGGLCSWGLEMTRRDAPDQLF